MSEKNEKKPMSFSKFLTQFNVVGLAIGIIMGSGAEEIANKVIENIVMPFIHPILVKITGDSGQGTKWNLWGGKDEGGVTIDFEPVIEITREYFFSYKDRDGFVYVLAVDIFLVANLVPLPLIVIP